ncbi:MAG: peptidylprolyl isomerase [Bacteroidales bacterium]|nr:peptidylprolyl isomerase [Bacteroidales bacterium]
MKKFIFCLLFLIIASLSFAQNAYMLDGIIAVVGKEVILRSDLEKLYAEYSSQFTLDEDDNETRCQLLKQLVYQKLLIHQADLDSIVITNDELDNTINYRMSMMIQQVGGNEKIIEDYYNKTIAEIKKDIREDIYNQLLVDQVQQSITANVIITPSEVKDFHKRIPGDSLPEIETTYEFGHIVKIPPVSEDEISAIKERLESYRERVLRGERFAMLARLYSDDPGSASKGGDLGFADRGTFYPEFEAAAFALHTGEISSVIKTQAGYHIIQMIERRGESIHVAHILIQPKPSAEEQVKAIESLDSVRNVILTQKMDFSAAAEAFSDAPDKLAGGWVVNPYSGSYKFERESIDPSTLLTLEKLIPGEYSSPVPYVNEDGIMTYRLLYLKSKVAAHQPNMFDDYDFIKNAALEEKKYNTLQKWVVNKVKVTSIKLNEEYKNCPFVEEWQIP